MPTKGWTDANTSSHWGLVFENRRRHPPGAVPVPPAPLFPAAGPKHFGIRFGRRPSCQHRDRAPAPAPSAGFPAKEASRRSARRDAALRRRKLPEVGPQHPEPTSIVQRAVRWCQVSNFPHDFRGELGLAPLRAADPRDVVPRPVHASQVPGGPRGPAAERRRGYPPRERGCGAVPARVQPAGVWGYVSAKRGRWAGHSASFRREGLGGEPVPPV